MFSHFTFPRESKLLVRKMLIGAKNDVFVSLSDATGSRVEVAKPVVEMDGDEMTRSKLRD